MFSELFGPKRETSISEKIRLTDDGEVILNEENGNGGMLIHPP